MYMSDVVTSFLDAIPAAKTQADYAAIYAKYRSWHLAQLEQRTWSAPIAAASNNLGHWLKMLAENGSLQQNWIDGAVDGVRIFRIALTR